MDRTYSLERVIKGLLCDEIVIAALNAKFGDKTEQVISEVKHNGVLEFNGEYLLDIFEDLLLNDARTYRTYWAEGGYGEFPISIMGLGTVFYYFAPEFGRVGYFWSVEDAASSLEINYCTIDFEKTIDYDIEIPKLEDMDYCDAASAACDESSGDPYLTELLKILERDEGTGNYSEKNPFTGDIHRFSWSTGMGRDWARGSYVQAFGKGPEWVARLHTGKQFSLYRLAKHYNRPLPDNPPTDD